MINDSRLKDLLGFVAMDKRRLFSSTRIQSDRMAFLGAAVTKDLAGMRAPT
ncbi:hypothetical protein PspTeo4_24800 [Pseudomonas sp. Teo4]|nr:hypothetical protein [Pseudomonas sp. Teo4]